MDVFNIHGLLHKLHRDHLTNSFWIQKIHSLDGIPAQLPIRNTEIETSPGRNHPQNYMYYRSLEKRVPLCKRNKILERLGASGKTNWGNPNSRFMEYQVSPT